MQNRPKTRSLLSIGAGVALVAFSSVAIWQDVIPTSVFPQGGEESANEYVTFTENVYDLIQKHYWDTLATSTLSTYYERAIQKASGNNEYALATSTQKETLTLFERALSEVSSENHTSFTESVNSLVVNALKPQGRNKLYTEEQKKELQNRVANTNPETNLYDYLGLEDGVSIEKVRTAYEERSSELEQQARTLSQQLASAQESERIQKLKQKQQQVEREQSKIAYAKLVLTNEGDKRRYDEDRVEPTVFTHTRTEDIFYVGIERFSPTTLQEFVEKMNTTKGRSELNTLIIDMRGNVGGSFDILPHFLGPFVGKDHVAFRLHRRDEMKPYKTKTGWLNSLVKFKRVIVLIDDATQSTAEVAAGALKKFNVGVLVGTTTRGWGTIESAHKVTPSLRNAETYSLLIVNHLTVRPDSREIEGNGITPHISVGDTTWQQQFRQYHNDQVLIEEVADLVKNTGGVLQR